MLHTMLPGIFVVGLVSLISSSAAYNTNAPVTIQLGPNACTSFTFDIGDKFSYDATLQGVVADPACNRSEIGITKLYVQGACISLRDNQLSWKSYKAISCLSADDDSVRSCNNVFNNAPSDALVVLGDLNNTSGMPIDAGDVCANERKGFFFVRNMCDAPVAITFQLNSRDYAGKLCMKMGKARLNGVAIGVIVVACLLGVFLLALLACCCCKCFC